MLLLCLHDDAAVQSSLQLPTRYVMLQVTRGKTNMCVVMMYKLQGRMQASLIWMMKNCWLWLQHSLRAHEPCKGYAEAGCVIMRCAGRSIEHLRWQ